MIIKKVSEIANIKTGKYDANHAVKNGKYIFFTCGIGQSKANTFSFEGELVILPGNGANLGEVFYYDGKVEAYQRTYVLYNIECDSRYLYYFLKLNWYRHVKGREVGSATNYMKMKDISEFEIPLSFLQTQKKIVQALDKAQKIIDLRKEQIELLDELIQSVFYDMFGDPAMNPKGLDKKQIGDIYEVRTGATPSRKNKEFWTNTNIPWVKTNEVINSTIVSTEESINQLAVEQTSVSLLPKNTILIAMYGQGKTRGRIAKLGIDATVNQACAALLPSQTMDLNFVFNYLRLSYKELRNLGRGGNQPNLNLSIVRNFELLVPPIELQNQFSEKVQKIEEQKQLMQESLTEMENNFNSLMQRAFKGELFD